MTPVMVIILDGFGLAPPGPGNAIYLANPLNINSYLYTYPNTTLKASGQAVGLPSGEAGNTEVGHLNLGAGRIVYQDLPRITMEIASGTFYKNKAFLKAIEHIKKTGGKLHLLGLIGEGTVHSSIEHLQALLFFAKENGIKNVFIHPITDGRDSPPKSAEEVIKRLEETLKEVGIGKIATIIGRYFAMDRDRRWERTKKAYECLTKGSQTTSKTSSDAIENSYKTGKSDEFIEPTSIIDETGKPLSLVEKGDSVIFFNYRIDRPRQLTKAFVLDNFEADANKMFSFDPYSVKYFKTHYPKEQIVYPPFTRGPKIQDLTFVTMTEYAKDLSVDVAFPPIIVQMPLGRVLSEKSLMQLRISESEKERFVTFYFNGQRETPFVYEDRLIVPSPKVPTYDMKPEMSAYELTDTLLVKIREQKYKFILINFANPDMVGHTGNIQGTVIAIKAVDSCLGKIVQEGLNFNYTMLITADHGNAEEKINHHTGEISTEHTDNPVPFIAINNSFQGKFIKLQSGILADVAPTVLSLLDIQKPQEMTGRDLLEEVK